MVIYFIINTLISLLKTKARIFYLHYITRNDVKLIIIAEDNEQLILQTIYKKLNNVLNRAYIRVAPPLPDISPGLLFSYHSRLRFHGTRTISTRQNTINYN